uniref:magnesium chelatase n=1 Tax=Salix viminalis TaxID=40686 RepID=A0A6N2K0D3_SALVM
MTRRLTSRARYAPPSTPEPPLHELNHVVESPALKKRHQNLTVPINYTKRIGLSFGRKYYGGTGLVGKKRRPQFHVAVASVATDIGSVEKAQKAAAKESQRPVYPFAAIVGQDEMKLCLLLNVIDPKIGDPEDPESMGIEVRESVVKGEDLTVVLTKINMVDLPLGATEDRVCGTIDIEKALTEGVKAFEPGLLAKANRGILYVDEVNLLDDHLVDVLLDSAASGWNTVEREGISILHPARFILIGSGNPEEGELRPQLLDRFGMHAQVGTVRDAELRVKIVEERARFDKNPKEFRKSYMAEQEKLQQQISSARSFLSSVQIDHDLKVKISKDCSELNVDGLSFGRKYYGGTGLVGKKRRPQFHVAVASVATDIGSVEKAQKAAAKESQRPVYPFAAIVGQDEMKLCLLLNVIDPKIGGVMIIGYRGTGKSTTVRSLVDLLPEIKVVSGDPYNSDPEDPESMGIEVRESVVKGEDLTVVLTKINMVDLPLGATEDRVCGTIDIEKALTEGVKAFEPGLLAKANRGILYVDEVNLLDDHLVDVLLDSAASGWNTVEREGISILHPARFILIGSGNPEEGELRPQLLDRFGMHAQVGTVRDAELRVKIVEERARFDKNPKEFRKSYMAEQEKLQQQISSARSFLSSVQIDHDLKVKISKDCSELNVDGLPVTELAAGASRGATTGRFVDSQDGWGGDEGGKECHENKDCEALVIENLQKRKMK